MTIGFRHDASPALGGSTNTLSHRSVPIWDGDGISMLFWFAESVVNNAHVPKECLYHPPKADISRLRCHRLPTVQRRTDVEGAPDQ
jgi:hypothetical protein